MALNRPRPPASPERQAEIRRDLNRERAVREAGYREKALRLLPHLCARCGRTFEGVRLKELTVHHRNGDHRSNPTDGSNWELLCVYCHDAEHDGPGSKARVGGSGMVAGDAPRPLANPFDALDALR
jgi:5-methylcytosine-specific restriction endonuclease McrA